MKKNRKGRWGIYYITVVVIFICVVIGIKNNELKVKSEDYKKKIVNLEKQIEKEAERTDEIEKQKEYMQTRKFIEDIARENFGLCYENTIIFKPEE